MAKDKNRVGVHGNDAETGRAERPKKACPITREQFKRATPVLAVINGENKALSPREFSTGSFGFHAVEKVTVLIDGVPTPCQGNLMLTVIGSKELPKS